MLMRTFISTLKNITILLLAALGSISCFAGSNWDGTYTYESTSGNTVGGSPISLKYVLTVSEKDCFLSIDGFQTMDRIKCKADAEDSTLHIRFKSYENGATANEFGVQIYKIDQILFDLMMHGHNITTTWKAEKPDEEKGA